MRAAALALYALVAAATVAVVRAEPGLALAGNATALAAELTVSAALLAAALGASRRRARPRFTAPLAAAGLALPLAEWNSPGAGAALTIGLAASGAWAPLLAHGALRGPDEQPLARAGMAVLVLAYGTAVGVLGVAAAAVFDPAAQGCEACPANRLLVAGDAAAWRSVERAGLALTIAWTGAYALLAAVRLARSTTARRRLTAPVLVPAAVALALAGAQAAHGLGRGVLSNDPVDRVLWAGQLAAVALTAAGVAWERVRARRTRAAVARLVVAFAGAPPPGGLEAQLAATLGDPGLTLLHAVDGGWVDGEGRTATLAPDREATMIAAGDAPVAAIVHRRGLLADPGQVDELAAAARLALEHERLAALRRAQLAQLRASRARIVAAADAERLRLERDLHDGAQQRLVALAIGVRLVRRAARDPQAERELAAAEEELRAAAAELRELAHGLFPAVLADEGLAAALDVLSEHEPRLVARDLPEDRLAPSLESAAYFVVAEALRRTGDGEVRVEARRRDGVLSVELATDRQLAGPATPIEDRVGALGGSLTITAHRLTAELPCAS